jgi:hypothetical protein
MERCETGKALSRRHHKSYICRSVRRPRQDSNLGTRLRRRVPNAHPGFLSTLQSQGPCLWRLLVSLVDGGSLHEAHHDTPARLVDQVTGSRCAGANQAPRATSRQCGLGRALAGTSAVFARGHSWPSPSENHFAVAAGELTRVPVALAVCGDGSGTTGCQCPGQQIVQPAMTRTTVMGGRDDRERAARPGSWWFRGSCGCLTLLAEMVLADCRCGWSRDLLVRTRRHWGGVSSRGTWRPVTVRCFAGWGRAMIGRWGPPRDRGLWPAGLLARGQAVSCPVPGCSSGWGCLPG